MNGVPVAVHVTAPPSPISHRTFDTLAVAVTVTPPNDALRVIGPNDCSDGASTHIHNGKPTTPIEPGRSSGTIPIVIARNCICSTIVWATTAGSTGAAGPAGIEADQNSPNGFATPEAPIRHE